MFYTRIPVPSDLPYSAELLNKSRKYFTLIGLIIGAIGCLSFVITNIFLPASIAVLLSMIASILATGAFHEDGFADTCDALGGGWEPEQILTIMKDSRIGTYGTVGLVAILALKALVLTNLTSFGVATWCICMIAAHTSSRLFASQIVDNHEYVQDTDKSKIKPIATHALDFQAKNFSLMVGLAPCLVLAFISFTSAFIGLLIAFIAAKYFMNYCQYRVGGYTGDILGATQQICEVIFLLSCLAFL